jgi:hypothetical protein
MTSTTPTPIETITPAFKPGDLVRFNGRTGTITRVYAASGYPLWYGTRRVIHTHCYEIDTGNEQTWGWVDAEVEATTDASV